VTLIAGLWGALGASALLIGALLALTPGVHAWLVARHEWRLGLLMAFGAGVLVSAVAFDLFEEAVRTSVNGFDVASGFAAGALTFFAGDELIERLTSRSGAPGDDGASALGITLGAVLDGIPESVVIGISLLVGERVSVAVVAAVFLSNIPEAISSTPGLAARYGTQFTLAVWAGSWPRARWPPPSATPCSAAPRPGSPSGCRRSRPAPSWSC